VQVTRDGGKNWTNVTKNIPNLPQWGTVSNIEPSRYDAGAAYITVDFHQVNNRDPFVYKTKDYGKTWKQITNGIPKSMLSYAHCVREDPTRPGLLYLGTENALYVTFDDGDNWQPLQANLPHAPVYWLTIQKHFNDLVIATYGRGFWILDDLTPIQQMSFALRTSDVYLFAPHATYRFRQGTIPVTMSDDPTVGQNPPYGAAISYYLKSAPAGDVKIRIQDGTGQTVRTLNGTKNVGLNRITWNLEGESTREVRLRTSPAYAPEIRVGPDGTRNAPGAPRVSMLLPPGNYTVKLSVGNVERSQPLVVKKDPNSEGIETTIAEQAKMLTELRKDLDDAAAMVNQIEFVRAQLYQVTAAVSDNNASAVKPAADDLDKKLIDIEEALYQRRLTGQGQDTVRWPPKLMSKLSYLAGQLGDSDFGPTNQQHEVQTLLHAQLTSIRQRFDAVLNTDLVAFNKLLRDRGVENVSSRTP
jgi:hypothetical protein